MKSLPLITVALATAAFLTGVETGIADTGNALPRALAQSAMRLAKLPPLIGIGASRCLSAFMDNAEAGDPEIGG
jgi:hypothetical protein